MNKILKLLSITFVVSSIFYFGCVKDTKKQAGNKIMNSNDLVTVFAPDLIYASNQLTFISRVLPVLALNYQFKSNMRNQLSSVSTWSKQNNVLDPYFAGLSPGYTYENNTHNEINSNFPSSGYVRSYFFGFFYSGCTWNTEVYGHEATTIDTTKPILVITQRPDGQEDSTGYYINPSGNLDSLILNDDNDEDFCIWVVRAIPDCGSKRGAHSIAGCDNDKRCEPWLGEAPGECTDCNGKGPGSGFQSTLYLVNIMTRTDELKKTSGTNWPQNLYQEGYFSGNYEASFQFYVYDSASKIDKASMLFNQLSNNFASDAFNGGGLDGRDADILDIWSATGNNCEIKRCKTKKNGSTKCNSGVHSLETYNKVMTFEFNPIRDKVCFLLYEYDYHPASVQFENAPPLSPQDDSAHQWQYRSRHVKKPWSFHVVGGTEYAYSTIYMNSVWTAGPPINGRPAFYRTLTLDGEMEITFAFTVN